jgi:hypothetical protein
MIRKIINRTAFAALILGGLIHLSAFFVKSEVEAGSDAWLPAAQRDAIAQLLNVIDVAVWPNFSADPFTCNATTEGSYYFNTTSSTFTVCDGSSWETGGGGVSSLTDLSDVFISSPTNNQVLTYDGVTDNRWENATPSASALTDLSNVTITTPSTDDVLQYNGSIWINAAGASPTTLAGLTDTTLTSPGDGDHLVHDGTDWKNVGFVDIPYWMMDDNVGGGGVTANQLITSDLQVRLYRVILSYEITVDNIIWRTDNDGGANCTCQGIGVYSADGNTLIGEGLVAPTSDATINNVDVSDFTIGPGEYWLAATSDDASTGCTFTTYSGEATTDTMRNTEATWLGQGANQATVSTCAFPATTGTITANSTGIHRPIVVLEGR